MTPPAPAYRSLVSPRSRRLRTVGAVLLTAILLMAAYGFGRVMPNVRREVEAQKARDAAVASTPVGRQALAVGTQAGTLDRAHKVVYAKVAAAYAYWGFCGLLVLAALFVAWLDLREVSRTYLRERQALRGDVFGDMERAGPENTES